MLRIVAGEWGGRRIQAPRGRGTRPTSERVREALFNVLAHQIDLETRPAFDLFAGSGALGIEALSRGSPHTTFVEADARAARQIAANLRALGAPPARWHVVMARVGGWLESAVWPEGPALLFLDPPYADDAAPLLARLAALPGLRAESWIVLETAAGAPPEPPPGLELCQAKRYGDTSLAFFSKSLRDAE